MRGGARAALTAVACLVAGLAAPEPASARGRGAPAPRGWVVDRVRLESAGPEGAVGAEGLGPYRGALEVVSAGGGLAVVNEVAFEDYLQGVAEVPSSWPLEALRAQAIAARTFALHEMGRQSAGEAGRVGADICATQACQVYTGLAKERQDHGPRWVAAVRSTRGQVLLYRGAPILAMYSSSNGGRSVAGGRPYLRPADDPDSARGPYGSWQVRLGYGEVSRVFSLPGALISLRRSGDTVVLDWDGGQTGVAVGDFRARLNESVPPQGGLPSAVPSTQFSVLADDASGAATLEGRGHGHGIGLSQFGALGKASRGMKAPAILASYYGGLKPTTLAPDLLPTTIRVAVATERRAVTSATAGRFRVLDGSGNAVAVAAHGAWRFLPAGRGRVRIVPPLDQEPPPTVDAVSAHPPDVVSPGGEARFTLGAAAAVRLRVDGAGLPAPVETAPVLVEPGEAALALPPLPGPGRYALAVSADAGAGRVTTVTVPLQVRPAPTAGGAALTGAVGAATDLAARPALLAWALLVLVVAGLGRTVVRHRRPLRRRRRAPATNLPLVGDGRARGRTRRRRRRLRLRMPGGDRAKAAPAPPARRARPGSTGRSEPTERMGPKH
ncbi:MAG: SpoIID/LytB domain-containing protein [Acidimicrobiia bacterium]